MALLCSNPYFLFPSCFGYPLFWIWSLFLNLEKIISYLSPHPHLTHVWLACFFNLVCSGVLQEFCPVPCADVLTFGFTAVRFWLLLLLATGPHYQTADLLLPASSIQSYTLHLHCLCRCCPFAPPYHSCCSLSVSATAHNVLCMFAHLSCSGCMLQNSLKVSFKMYIFTLFVLSFEFVDFSCYCHILCKKLTLLPCHK